jgi:hypothetical protein
VTELLVAGLLAAAVVVFVALPFLRETDPPAVVGPAEGALAAAEERDRVLAELKELEFDHRTGKISDEDYKSLVQPLRQQASRLLSERSSLSEQTPKNGSEQRFSDQKLPSGRPDR